jgi:hypothetical protein
VCIFGLLLCEGFLYRNNDEYYDLLSRVEAYAKSQGIEKLYLIAGICEQYQQELDKRNLDYKIIFWDYSVGCVWESYKNKLDQLPNWNPEAGKFLFLTGVPSRPNRIGLLSKYWDSGLLSKSEWSFFPPWTDEDKIWCREHLSRYDDATYDKFISYCDRTIDNKYLQAKDYSRINGKDWNDSNIKETEFIKDPNWIDPRVFSATSLSIISEGHCYPPANDDKFLTEKTWRAVVNRHPIIMADSISRYNYVIERGLRVVNKYDTDNYDSMMDSVVNTTEYFLNSINQNLQKIKKDVNHNFLRFIQIVEENEMFLNVLKTQYYISEEDINQWFRQKSFTHLFRIPTL